MRAALLLLVLGAAASESSKTRRGRLVFGGRKVSVEAVTDTVVHAEGPHWTEPYLYYVDISSSALLRLDTVSGNVSRWIVEPGDSPITLVVPLTATEGRVLISRGRELVEFDTVSGKVVSSVANADVGRPGNRFNDGKADPQGRLWAGTMGPEEPGTGVVPAQGSLYLLGSDGLASKVSGVDVSNGLAWSADSKLMYYVDTGTGRVDVFDFDANTGAIENRRVAMDLKNSSCLPDGIALDSEAKLWVACWGGWQVLRVDPVQGQVIGRVALPAQYVTSVAWGGKGTVLDTLYVSTSKRDLSPEQVLQQPLAGAIFKITGLGVNGTPANHVTWPLKPLPSTPKTA